jgi:signal transduction histidine kinase
MTPNGSLPLETEKNAFLSFFDAKTRAALLACAELITCKADQRIFREGDAADSIYLVLCGKIRLTKKDPVGKEQFLALVQTGDFFGEFGVLDGHPRSAGAAAAEDDTRLVRLPREAVVRAFQESSGESVMRLAQHIISKVRETNQRYVEERLRKERMTLIGEMADRIIHDLKSPFCVIQLVADMLRQNRGIPVAELCDLLETQLRRMQSMIEEILDFSRGQPQIKPVDVRLSEFVRKLEEYNRYYFEQMHVRWSAEVPDIILKADPDKLLRAFQNLITNSVEAFAGKEGRIAFRAAPEGDKLMIALSDNGPGIPEEMRGVFFEPFATMGKAKGTGLGMAVAKSIIEAHGGRINFESEGGKGTTFYIVLSLRGESLATHG